ncbi:MAG: tetratricopeptide repeat protein [Firmicutes bacterium]|nr:tetratricopeptide repeat protein [Bacillota bacterium]
MKKIMIALFLFLAAIPCFGADKYVAFIESAENSFGAGDYKQAIEIYESLIQIEKVKNPYLYYNLSNAYYRSGELGKAIVNIEKAFILKPADKNIRHNRLFLRNKAGAGEPEDFFSKVTGFCSLNTITILFSAAVIFILLSVLLGGVGL